MSKKASKGKAWDWFPKIINILGTEYKCFLRTQANDPDLNDRAGYIWYRMKQIVVRDFYNQPGWEKESDQLKLVNVQEALRHEILHGFLFESGLADSTIQIQNGWAKNEEMIDWLALQAPKIFKAYQEAGCL